MSWSSSVGPWTMPKNSDRAAAAVDGASSDRRPARRERSRGGSPVRRPAAPSGGPREASEGVLIHDPAPPHPIHQALASHTSSSRLAATGSSPRRSEGARAGRDVARGVRRPGAEGRGRVVGDRGGDAGRGELGGRAHGRGGARAARRLVEPHQSCPPGAVPFTSGALLLAGELGSVSVIVGRRRGAGVDV